MEFIKNLVVKVLNWAAVGYIKRNHIRVIAVAGSVGKTSTANAIRTVLSQHYQVHRPKTTYNVTRSVHLEMFDMNFASNPIAWAWVVVRVLIKTLGRAKYQVLVIEIGTDHPGELQSFAFLKPQIGVLTAVVPEHMEWFKTIEAVAAEELSITTFCDKLVFNADAVDRRFVPEGLQDRLTWYGMGTEYVAENYRIEANKTRALFTALGKDLGDLELEILGKHSLGALLAATVVGLQCDLDHTELAAGLQAVRPVKGRMQRLVGLQNSVIIDDTYNASPEACKAALDVLYQFEVPQRIAVLGMMNEMGDYSPEAHRQVGAYCDPSKLEVVVTVGADANEYLAAVAEARGCQVERCASPYEAGTYVKSLLRPGAVLLFKGSQNRGFIEEAIKSVLANPTDADHLVRQSDYWMSRKRVQFGEAAPGARATANTISDKQAKKPLAK